MKITGIEALKFGVVERAKATAFLADFGLSRAASDIAGADLFLTLNHSRVYLFDVDDPRLPAPFEPGSTLREVVWGVASAACLSQLAERLADDPSLSREADCLRCQDPNGMTLRFQLGGLRSVELAVAPINQHGDIRRVNEASPVYERGEPIGIGHVVFFTPDLATTEAFYRDRLGFHLSDSYQGKGAFMRCAGQGHHHDLFLLHVPGKSAGLNHVAFTVRDIHEVIGAGMAMNRHGWSTFIGPGRHPISSAYFWYVNSPLGGAFEYYTNDDYLTEAWQPRTMEHSLALFTEWAVEGGLDGHTRRQIKQEA
ncbi:VOC family protein [Aeromonas cavernicola]|uniref:Glyoxalase n=1 Tax=Aeromonas cavernicola TaxID=1006623 RepID=A0A2H9U9F9_9GAMM|nr:VOC family protein [Aeromonas cavernicola]PJG60648.1 glyoxalase [Aeromonas cavernicola]